MRTRNPVGVAACAALLLAAGPVVPTGPAYAEVPRTAEPAVADRLGGAAGVADLVVRVEGATMPSAAPEKVLTATVTNRGAGAARNAMLRVTGWVDSETVNPSSVDFCPTGDADVASAPTVAPSLEVRINNGCNLADLQAGRSVTLRAVLRGSANAVGAAGSVTAEVTHAGPDPTPADNTVTTPLTLVGPVDQRLYARTWGAPADATGAVRTVLPGHGGDLRFEVGNRGEDLVGGMTVTLHLPAHVRFAETRPGCAYGLDRRSATCTYADLPVVPAAEDTEPADGTYSALRFLHRMEVSAAAPAPARLDGGRVSVAPLETGYLPGVGVGTPSAALPPQVTGVRAREFRSEPASAGFVVHIGAPGDDEAGLPVTGGSAARAVVGGATLVTAGLALLLLTRRRRAA